MIFSNLQIKKLEIRLVHSVSTSVLPSNPRLHQLNVHLVAACLYLEATGVRGSNTKALKLL